MSKVQFTEAELIDFIEELTKDKNKVNKPILSESKSRKLEIWKRRFERKNLNKPHDVICENFYNEILKLNRNGISPDDVSLFFKSKSELLGEQTASLGGLNLNQGVFGTLWEIVREKLYRWLLSKFGVEGELQEVLADTLGNVPFFDLPKLMNCNYLAPILTKGIIEYAVRKAGRSFTGMSGTFEQAFGNSLDNLLDNTEFYQSVLHNVTERVCGALGEKREQVQGAINNVESEYEGNEAPNQKTSSTDGGATNTMASDMVKKYFDMFKQNLAK